MGVKIDRAEVVSNVPPDQRSRLFPGWTDDNDRRISVDATKGECRDRVELHCDTDFAIVATDGTEIKEIVSAAQGALGVFAEGAATPQTVLNGVSIGSDLVSNVLGKQNHSADQELSFTAVPCETEVPRRYRVTLEIIGDWVVSDPDARFDPEERAQISLVLRAAGAEATETYTHAKRTSAKVSFPIARKTGAARFMVQVVTPPRASPFKVYARLVEEVQTNGPGNSVVNPIDLLEDLFTNAVSAIRIDSIFIVIEELGDEDEGE